MEIEAGAGKTNQDIFAEELELMNELTLELEDARAEEKKILDEIADVQKTGDISLLNMKRIELRPKLWKARERRREIESKYDDQMDSLLMAVENIPKDN